MYPRDVLDANLRIVYGGVQRARRDRIAALWRSIVVTHAKGKRLVSGLFLPCRWARVHLGDSMSSAS
jgi:hypothetical protein